MDDTSTSVGSSPSLLKPQPPQPAASARATPRGQPSPAPVAAAAAPSLPDAAGGTSPPCAPAPGEDAQTRYLDTHNIYGLVDAALQTLLADLPEDPYEALAASFLQHSKAKAALR